MKTLCKLLLFAVSFVIVSCQGFNKQENKLAMYSTQLIKRSTHNDDMLVCCFSASNPDLFYKKIKQLSIKDVRFPLAEQLGLNFYSWKVKRYNLDSNIFMIGLLVPRGRISAMTNDSVALMSRRLTLNSEIYLILENNDTLTLSNVGFDKTSQRKIYFSVKDTNWVGISR